VLALEDPTAEGDSGPSSHAVIKTRANARISQLGVLAGRFDEVRIEVFMSPSIRLPSLVWIRVVQKMTSPTPRAPTLRAPGPGASRRAETHPGSELLESRLGTRRGHRTAAEISPPSRGTFR
jgi:hypothetical protein